ncbi:MAG TPA: helix-turn-helix transcriptional regulator [Novosphingobium sp.]|nr:helix-turn-helix transcriptional regulator [Novosphingobium sp.]
MNRDDGATLNNGGSKLTPFGEIIREIRKSKGILLIDLARITEVTPGFLSLVETGKKPIPDRLISTIVTQLELSKATEKKLLDAADLSARDYRIHMEAGADILDRRIAHAMQTGLAKMSPEKKSRILKLLEE